MLFSCLEPWVDTRIFRSGVSPSYLTCGTWFGRHFQSRFFCRVFHKKKAANAPDVFGAGTTASASVLRGQKASSIPFTPFCLKRETETFLTSQGSFPTTPPWGNLRENSSGLFCHQGKGRWLSYVQSEGTGRKAQTEGPGPVTWQISVKHCCGKTVGIY